MPAHAAENQQPPLENYSVFGSALNSIWERSGNINALDVQRILRKQPESFEAWRSVVAAACGEPRIGAAVRRQEHDRDDAMASESQARALSERMAVLWQAALLVAHAPASVGDAFLSSRIEGAMGRTFGTLPIGAALRSILDRSAAHPRAVNG